MQLKKIGLAEIVEVESNSKNWWDSVLTNMLR
jgi:hypothetical protein